MKLRILLGCYNTEMAIINARTLRGMGHDVNVIDYSSDVLKEFRENQDKYDLIITNNLYKCDMTGKKLFEEIRTFSDIPIVVCSAEDWEDIYDPAPYDGYLKKPIDEEKAKVVFEKIFGEK